LDAKLRAILLSNCTGEFCKLRRHEFFRIKHFHRTYDRTEGKFSFNISYETHTKVTPRSLAVAEAFGLGVDESQKFKILEAELKIGPNDIVYLTGESGSGKSVLLRAIKADLGDEAADLSEVCVDPDKPLIETIGKTVEEAIELLSRVGLNDAFLFLRTYDQLSDGQKTRYRMAKLVESGRQWWLIDEFAACLDRDTAKVVAFNLQRIARKSGKAVIAATTHSDLLDDLSPSVHVHKRFGEEIQIRYFPNEAAKECSLMREMRVEEGTLADWRSLCRFHYRGHKVAVPRKIFRLVRNKELCGVIVYSYPPPSCYGRRLVLPRMSMQELNTQLSVLSRVVVHPKYRTMGLGVALVRESLPRVGTPYVEMVAVMAKYNPFAEKAGMLRIAEQQPSEQCSRIAQAISDLHFDMKMLGSRRYLKEKVERLDTEQLLRLREAFARNRHPRIEREFTSIRKCPYGNKTVYVEALKNADIPAIVELIRIVGVLLQKKIYLFWKNNQQLR